MIFAVYVCDYERILSFYHSIGSPIDRAHPGPKTDRDNLGSIPGSTTFFLSLCRFKGLRTVTAQIISIGLRTWVSPVYRAPNAVIKAQDSFVITNIHSKYHLYMQLVCIWMWYAKGLKAMNGIHTVRVFSFVDV